MLFRKKKPDPAKGPPDLRAKALSVSAEELGLSRGDSPVWGVLMETGYPEAVATLVTFAEGTTSLYFSNGGGVIGAGEHDGVRDAAAAFLDEADNHLPEFSATTEFPLPDVGRVRFYLRTFDGIVTAERGEEDLGEERDALAPLFHAGHAVIGEIREIEGS